MGNCFRSLKKSTAEIVPSDTLKLSPVAVRLYGSSTSPLTSYIRFALSYKPVSLRFIPSETPDFGSETPVLQCGSEVVSGSPLTLLRYLDAKFPDRPLVNIVGRRFDETTPLVVSTAVLQHRSMRWHLERLVRWGEDLVTRGGRASGDPVMGSPRMEVKKLGRSYSQLLEVMLEHAQMEERIVFSILEKADRGKV